jgi:hypothetical protein
MDGRKLRLVSQTNGWVMGDFKKARKLILEVAQRETSGNTTNIEISFDLDSFSDGSYLQIFWNKRTAHPASRCRRLGHEASRGIEHTYPSTSHDNRDGSQ